MRRIRNIVSGFIFFLIFFIFSACSVFPILSEYEADPNLIREFRCVDGIGFAKAQLTPEEAELYDRIDQALGCGAERITEGLEAYSDQTIIRVYRSVLLDRPEYFWLRDSYRLECRKGLLRAEKTLFPVFAVPSEKIAVYQTRLNAVCSKLLHQAEQRETDYEKLLFLHDAIVKTVSYDTVAYTDIDTDQPSELTLESTTMYGALVNGRALCGGYAKALQYLAESAGIRCTVVSGHKKDGEAHAWNLVQLDGDYYYVDVTWDDPVPETGKVFPGERNFYNYFCITEAELLKTHRIDGDNPVLPVCTADTYQYFFYHQLFFESYTRESAAAVLRHAVGERRSSVSVQFADAGAMESAIRDLFEKGTIFEILAESDADVQTAFYSRDEIHCVVTMCFVYL